MTDDNHLTDLDLGNLQLHTINQAYAKVGPGFYFDDDTSPTRMYYSNGNKFIEMPVIKDVTPCLTKTPSRPEYYSNSWIRKQGFGCKKTEAEVQLTAPGLLKS